MICSFFFDRDSEHIADLFGQDLKVVVPFQQVLEIRQALQTHPIGQAGEINVDPFDVVDGIVKPKKNFNKN